MPDDSEQTGFVMDRDLQRALLEQMRASFPGQISGLSHVRGYSWEEKGALIYLRDHGLCSVTTEGERPRYWSMRNVRITAAGLDFLEQDGGLTAILGVVTVKFHADTIRDLLTAKVDASDLPAEKKSALRSALGKLSGAALQAGTGDLVKMGLEHGPNAVHWIEKLVTGLT